MNAPSLAKNFVFDRALLSLLTSTNSLSSSFASAPAHPSNSKKKKRGRISLAWIVPAYECAKLLRTLPPPAPLPSSASSSETAPALPPKHPHFSPEQSAAVRRFATLFVAVAAFSALSPVADALLFWLPLYEARMCFFSFWCFGFWRREREREKQGKKESKKTHPLDFFLRFPPLFFPLPPPPQIQTQKQEIKVAFLAWLLLPGTRGADVLFERAFVPLLEEHGPALDAAVSRARATVSAHASEKAGLALKALRGKAAAAVAQLQAAAASAGASASASPAKRKA